jgi:hypothetical protein
VKLSGAVGSRKQAILLAVLAVVLGLAVVRWRPGGGAKPVPARAPAARPGVQTAESGDDGRSPAAAGAPRAARRSSSREVSPDEVPLLSVEDVQAVPPPRVAEGGRDLFDLQDPTRPPVPTPTPAPPVPGDIRFIGPLPPPPPTPTPRPPEVSFKFIGTFGPKDHPIAVLQQGDQVVNARAGDVLFGRFILRKVGFESIDVGFVGFAESETRRLGITQ